MSSVTYNSNGIFTSNINTQTLKDLLSFGTNVIINGNVGIGTIRPFQTFHVENVTFNMKFNTNENNVYSTTYNQYYGLLPIGSIIMIPSQRLVSILINQGWLECDGSTYNQVNYPLLEPLLRSTNYGNSIGFNSTFKVPNLINRIPVGAGGTYSQSYYNTNLSRTITLSVQHIPPHSHSGNTDGPTALGSHSHTVNEVSTGWNQAIETNSCCGGTRTNSIITGTTTTVNSFSDSTHSHANNTWGHLNQTALTSISLERNKIYMIYMIKGK